MCLCDREHFLQTGFWAHYFGRGRLWANRLSRFKLLSKTILIFYETNGLIHILSFASKMIRIV